MAQTVIEEKGIASDYNHFDEETGIAIRPGGKPYDGYVDNVQAAKKALDKGTKPENVLAAVEAGHKSGAISDEEYNKIKALVGGENNQSPASNEPKEEMKDGKENVPIDQNKLTKEGFTYLSKADDYKEERTLESNNPLVQDVSQVDKATHDYVNAYGQEVKEGEGINHHTHTTKPYNSAKIDVATTRALAEKYQANNILITADNKKLLNKTPEDIKGYSKTEFAAIHASTGQHSYKDSVETWKALHTEEEIAKERKTRRESYFEGTNIQNIFNQIVGEKYDQYCSGLRSDVEALNGEFGDCKTVIDDYIKGSTNAENIETLECLKGKFLALMANIDNRLEPICDAVQKLAGDNGLMQQLQKGEQELVDLEKKVEAKKEEVAAAQEDWKDALALNIPKTRPKTVYKLNGQEVSSDMVKAGAHIETIQEANEPQYGTWVSRCAELEGIYNQKKTELEGLEKEVQSKVEALNDLQDQVFELLDDIRRYDTEIKSAKRYINDGNPEYEWLHNENGKYDPEKMIRNHDAIMKDLQDFEKFPVITNKSDYKAGDVVFHDDATGNVYVITEEWDPIEDIMKIQCIDKNGNIVGKEITLMDQREIAPIKAVKKLDNIYEPYPERVERLVPPTIPGTTPKPPKPVPPEPKHPDPPTPPNPPELTDPPGIIDIPIEVVITQPPEPVVPFTTIIFEGDTDPTVAGSGYNPYAPHTGLDGIYGSKDTSQSSVGLGALAGLAAGAAGLGLTGLIKDRKDEEEEKKENNVEENKETVENIQNTLSSETVENKPQDSNPIIL